MKKIFTIFAAALTAMSMSVQAATPVANLNFEIKTGDTDLPENYVYSSSNTPNIKVQNGVTCIIISDGGASTAPTFNDPDEPSGGKRWMAFCPDTDCSATISVMSNKKQFFIQNKDGEFFAYTNTTNAVEEVVVENLKANQWYAMCGGSSQVYVTKIVFSSSCEAPAEALSLSANKTENVLVGDVITFTTAGGNGSEITLYDGENEISSPWTATAGAHSFTAVQEANDGVCGAITEAIEINVISQDPVASAVIAGPTAGAVSDELTYTVEAANATVFAWYVDGELQAETSATFVYIAVLGNHTIYATASNAYTDVPVQSNEIALVVSPALFNDTYIWKKGSGYTGCVENPNVDPNANQAETVLEHSRCDISGATKMGRADNDNVEVAIQFTANEGLYIQEICTYGKLEEPDGAQISWDGKKWEHIDAYTEGEISFNAPAGTYPTLFIIKFMGVSHSSGGIWWRNALLTISSKPEGTAIDNTNAEIKAVKVIRNGQLFIEKNGVIYNAQGAVVK